MNPDEQFSAEEQAQFDAMREADAAEPAETSVTADPAATPSPSDAPKPQKTVPLAALHEERERRKEADRQLAEERQRIRTLEERTNLLLQRFGQPQPQPAKPEPRPEIPPVDKDPVGHIVGQQQELARQIAQNEAALRAQQSERERQQQAQQFVQNLTQRAQGLEQVFTMQQPDYPEAVKYLIGKRHEELQAIGLHDPAERHLLIQQEGLGLAARSIQDGANPAQAIYALAKMRGYAAPQPNPQPQLEAGREQPDAGQRLANIAAGQQQARSLGNTRGSGPAPLTAQRLLEMPQAEFAKMLDTAEGMALLGA